MGIKEHLRKIPMIKLMSELLAQYNVDIIKFLEDRHILSEAG